MPRLLTDKTANCGSMKDGTNDYITSQTLQQTEEQQQYVELQLQTQFQNITNFEPNTIIQSNQNEIIESSAQLSSAQSLHEQQIHTIYSSDEEGLFIDHTIIEPIITKMSSEGSGDFEGFDDYTSPNTSGLVNDTILEDLNISYNNIKRHSHADFHEYVDSEDAAEAIDLDGEGAEEIVVNKDGKTVYRTVRKVTPRKFEAHKGDPHTPNKRKKNDANEEFCGAFSTTQLKTPPDQIVEVNSDSTTNSLMQKRQQINNKFQFNLCQQNLKTNNNPNRCSTESTSEFPVSSPSNPQQPRGGKYPPRPPLLKNTLPADSFERQLAMLAACNPQMTLAEKIQSWDCEDEISDLEDVRKFDEDFKRVEKQKKIGMKQKEKCDRLNNSELKSYDFVTFRQMIIDNIKEQKNKKYSTTVQGGCGVGGISGTKGADSSESESSKSVVHVDDRPSTSAVAQQLLQQRRSKPQLYFETGEPKKRIIKNIPKRNQNSTTPPQTSSSDNERDCFKKSNNNTSPRQILIHEKLICPSSSEEAVSHYVPTERHLKANNKQDQVDLKNKTLRSQAQTNLNEIRKPLMNSRIITEEEVESFFRPHRLNKERDKVCIESVNENEDQSTSIIQMRLDFSNKSTTEEFIEKKQDLFKTPIIPQKYLAYPLLSREYQKQNNSFLSTKRQYTNEDENKFTSDNVSEEKTTEIKSTFNDLDGVYHEQHEFCNYLGLTGMSTATAMANAVAELAQCNLARRSMRVFRQQQQERRDKSAKEERLQKSLKTKQLKQARKQDKEETDVSPAIVADQITAFKSDEGSQSQLSEPIKPVKQSEKNTRYNSSTISQVSASTTPLMESENKKRNNSTTKSQNSLNSLQNETEIKIICHAAAKNEEEAEKFSSDCKKEITKPVKEMRQMKQRNSKSRDTKANIDDIDVKSSQNVDRENTENVDGATSVKIIERTTRILKSPALPIGNSLQKRTRSRSQIPFEQMAIEQIVKTSVTDDTTGSVTKSVDIIKCASPFLKNEESNIEVKLNKEQSTLKDISLISSNTHFISTHADIIKKKIQMALEESRKTKPSIFIVQSLESQKKKVNNNINRDFIITQTNVNSAAPRNKEETNKEIPPKHNNKNEKAKKRNVFKKTQSKKYPISKRRLRKRKIIVIKTMKPKLKKSHRSLTEIKKELRSSPRINENKKVNYFVKKNENSKQRSLVNKISTNNETKSYRNVHTETKDLETYLQHQLNKEAKTRLMAKASSLLERSRRMSLRNNCNLVKNKINFPSKTQESKLKLRGTKANINKPQLVDAASERIKNRILSKTKQISPTTQKLRTQTTNSQKLSNLENENVVVSSTTNTFEERPAHESSAVPSINRRTLNNSVTSYAIAASTLQTKDQQTQCNLNANVHYLNTPPLPLQTMRNPLKTENGAVLYIYYEVDVLIVIQESLISFWKCSKLINMFVTSTKLTIATCSHQIVQQDDATFSKQNLIYNCCSRKLTQSATSSTMLKPNDYGDWIQLGELERFNHDYEISVPYGNRICLHNSTPIYLEMRAQNLPKNQRDCNLLSMYINIYFYHDEEMIAKRNSIQLDSIQSDIKSVNYTTLTDSRYFIVTWPQENLLGKTRSGLCKYSLTPQLDTLASIREFKSMRHTIRYLECMSDDKLIGFGETQVTIWDYRSGDVLMNFDLEIPMGKNLGSIYFPSQDIEQNHMLILHQFRHFENNSEPELMTIACTVTHTQPSYKLLQHTNMPLAAFKMIKSAIKTGDHFVITGLDDDEIWISLTNPKLMTVIPRLQNTRRFYGRERSQLIELTEKTLNVNSLTNHILQLAAG